MKIDSQANGWPIDTVRREEEFRHESVTFGDPRISSGDIAFRPGISEFAESDPNGIAAQFKIRCSCRILKFGQYKDSGKSTRVRIAHPQSDRIRR